MHVPDPLSIAVKLSESKVRVVMHHSGVQKVKFFQTVGLANHGLPEVFAILPSEYALYFNRAICLLLDEGTNIIVSDNINTTTSGRKHRFIPAIADEIVEVLKSTCIMQFIVSDQEGIYPTEKDYNVDDFIQLTFNDGVTYEAFRILA